MTSSNKPTKEELRDMIEKGMSLYKISRMYNTTIPVIFQLEKDYDIIPKTFILKKCYHISKEDLESMYIDERMTQWQIAEELGCSQGSVYNMMNYYHIQARVPNGKYTPQEQASKIDEIIQLYNDGMSQEKIAKKVGYSRGNVERILHEHGVQTRPGGKYTPQEQASKIDEIVQRYNNGETQEEIAKKVGYSYVHIGRILHEHNVQTRGSGRFTPQQRSLLYDKIVQMYNEGMTQEEIAERVGYSLGNVCIILQKRGAQTRGPTGTITTQKISSITASKLQECIDKGMDQHKIAEHFGVHDATIYKLAKKFGISGMVDDYRCSTPKHIAWRDEVFARDNYTCQMCGKTGVRLEAHHIYPFRYYPERQFDVDNGITLCHGCHYKVTGHEYEYIVELEDIVLRDRHIGDDIEPGIDYIDYLARKFDQKGVDIFGGELPVHEYTSIPKEE